MLLTPFLTVGGNCFLTIPVFLLLFTAADTIYGWLQLISSSVWPAAILNGSFNFLLDVFTVFTLHALQGAETWITP
jgi:cell shape-determining protein MreD